MFGVLHFWFALSFSEFLPNEFTEDPDMLKGERLFTQITKADNGFGFTVLGSENENEDFLHVKQVVKDGAAWNGGVMRPGNFFLTSTVLCYLSFVHI